MVIPGHHSSLYVWHVIVVLWPGMNYEEQVFDALDTTIVEENGRITVSGYGWAGEEPYDLFEELAEEGLVEPVRRDQYVVTDDGRDYHSSELAEDVIDVLEGTASITEISDALGYDGCDQHTPRHDCAINAVRRSLRILIGDARVSSTPAWCYTRASKEREKRDNTQ